MQTLIRFITKITFIAPLTYSEMENQMENAIREMRSAEERRSAEEIRAEEESVWAEEIRLGEEMTSEEETKIEREQMRPEEDNVDKSGISGPKPDMFERCRSRYFELNNTGYFNMRCLGWTTGVILVLGIGVFVYKRALRY